jgi:hypothetical protein
MGNEFVGKARSPSDWKTTPRSTCPAFRRSFACQRSERAIERVSRGRRRRHHTQQRQFRVAGLHRILHRLPTSAVYWRFWSITR